MFNNCRNAGVRALDVDGLFSAALRHLRGNHGEAGEVSGGVVPGRGRSCPPSWWSPPGGRGQAEVPARQHGLAGPQSGGRRPSLEAGRAPQDGYGRERRPKQAAHEGHRQEDIPRAQQGREEGRPRLLLRSLRRHVDHPRHRHFRGPPRHSAQVHRVNVTAKLISEHTHATSIE